MCGISLIVSNDKNSLDKIGQMNAKVIHRGPDAQGVFQNDILALGHTRLSIIDLDERSNQPFVLDEYVMSYNGEIYNYRELRKELEDCGYTFKTSSDTEVVLRAYQHWKSECFSKFNGMWALVIFNKESHEVLLSRDRYGIKPLFFYQDEDLFLAGSELKQFEIFSQTQDVNYDKVYNFIVNSLVDYDSETFYKNINSLSPGSFLILDAEKKDFTSKYYYKLMSERSSTKSVEELLQKSITLRLRSDVPIGTCLSGGIDSSLIAILAREKIPSGDKFIGIHGKSTEKASDESEYAKIISFENNIDLKIIEPISEDFLEDIELAIETQDEPFLSSSILMQFNVMKEASENRLKVLLDGQGADEIFLGYTRYLISAIWESSLKFRWISTYKLVRGYLKNNSFYSFAKLLASAHFRKIILILKMFETLKVKKTFKSEQKKMFFWKTKKFSNYDILTGSLASLLRYEDRNSMYFSIETRLPFLDFELVEKGLSLDVNQKINGAFTKSPLREILGKYTKTGINLRTDKIGFASPEKTWINENESTMNQLIKSSNLLNELFLFKKEISYENYRMFYWRLFIVAIWEKKKGIKT
ncbi:MAG: asparagine synthase (glutamine-hydrolyzing) [Halobacteriovoraceae bacterium]|nr:asparagine synthase (glutamine-hydrolyzing) [Halobacteriovoraceae bacterium]|tara:strand:+ start:5339 stop:7099 length:1761 start_codon:yes stop_codon:yes gene_type:complete